MEVSWQESRGRPSRVRRDVSNKENICPLEGRDMAFVGQSGEIGRRRSPLPDGFPRSPLQDITHIISPHNVWPDDEGSLAAQTRKKPRKGNCTDDCNSGESERNNLSGQGLTSNVLIELGRKKAQIEEIPAGKVEQTERRNDGSEEGKMALGGRDCHSEREEAGRQEVGGQDRDGAKERVEGGGVDGQNRPSEKGKVHEKAVGGKDLKQTKKKRGEERHVQILLDREQKKRPQTTGLKSKNSILKFR